MIYVIPESDLDAQQGVVLPIHVEIIENQYCPGGVIYGNFEPQADMQLSLRKARQICLGQLTRSSNILTGLLIPFLGKEMSPLWLGVLLTGLVSIVSLVVQMILAFGPYRDPSLLIPNWRGIILIGSAASTLAVLFVPLRWRLLLRLRAVLAKRKNLKEFLSNACFKVYIGNRNDNYEGFRGYSGDLSFVLSMSEAVANSQPHFRMPWQDSLVSNNYVASAMLTEDGTVKEVDGLDIKLRAIRSRGPQDLPLGLGIFCIDDQSKVETAWRENVSQNQEVLTRGQGNGCGIAKSKESKVTFVFCRHVNDFLRFLYPFGWRWIWLRLAAVVLLAITIILSIGFPPPTPPEFKIECVPPLAYDSNRPGIHSASVLLGEKVPCDIKITSRGFPGAIDINLASNFHDTVSPTLDGEPRKQFSIATTQDQIPFYFVMPKNATPGVDIVVVATVVNRAAKYRGISLFFAPVSPPSASISSQSLPMGNTDTGLIHAVLWFFRHEVAA